ncbi:MAG: hypothetical protein ACO1TE_26730 [Prosthecobacter sp.]
MTAVAEHLDRTLRSLSSDAAASVEQLVWDVIKVVEIRPGQKLDQGDKAIRIHQAHIDECLKQSAELDWSDFERPAQGEEQVREDW